MPKNITLKFSSSGIQSDIYYLTPEILTKLESKEIEGLPPIQFIEQYADKTLNLSSGICYDHDSFEVYLLDGDREEKLEVQNFDDIDGAGEDDWVADPQKLIIDFDSTDFSLRADLEPSDHHVAAVFNPITYGSGSITCPLTVDDDFCPSDIRLILASLEVGQPDGFVNMEIYRQSLNTLDEAESEIHGLEYKGERYDFGYDLSFWGGSGSLTLYKYDQDEKIWLADYFTNVFDEDDLDDDYDIETVVVED